jgi:hypothetical protein
LVQISTRICLKQLRKVSVKGLILESILNSITVRSINISKAENSAANTLIFRDFSQRGGDFAALVDGSTGRRWFRDPLSNDKGSID